MRIETKANGFTIDLSALKEGQLIDVIRVKIDGKEALLSPDAKGRYHFKHYEEKLILIPKEQSK